VITTLCSLGVLMVVIVTSLLIGVEKIDLRIAFSDPGSVDATILFATRATRIALARWWARRLLPRA